MPKVAIHVLEKKYWADDLWINGFARGGVGLGNFAARFGDRGISLGAMIQRPHAGDLASLVFLTHPASEENARSAVDEIATLDFCHGQPRVLRVLAA